MTDLDNDGIVDTLHYYLGDTSELSGTPNENDRLLYRVVNSVLHLDQIWELQVLSLFILTRLAILLVIQSRITGVINTMQIDIRIEDTVGYNLKYSSIFWRQIRISNRNLETGKLDGW